MAFTLPESRGHLLCDVLARSLTAERLRTTNPGAVELLALACSALTPGASVRAMTLAAASDYLLESEHFAAVAGWVPTT